MVQTVEAPSISLLLLSLIKGTMYHNQKFVLRAVSKKGLVEHYFVRAPGVGDNNLM